MDETEDETNPREFGGEVDAMSGGENRISGMRNSKVADSLYVEKKRSTYSDL